MREGASVGGGRGPEPGASTWPAAAGGSAGATSLVMITPRAWRASAATPRQLSFAVKTVMVCNRILETKRVTISKTFLYP